MKITQEFNSKHKALRAALGDPSLSSEARRLFALQHGMTHSAEVYDGEVRSYADEVLDGLAEDDYRVVPKGTEHSVVWLLWHSARCEDITMNRLTAGMEQVLFTEGWHERLGVEWVHSGNAISQAEMEVFSQSVDVGAVCGYRNAVGVRTQEIVSAMDPAEYGMKVDPERAALILEEGAVVPEAIEIWEYWRTRTIAGLLLMPATRHNLVHLNEVVRVRRCIS